MLKKGVDRNQIQMFCLEAAVEENSIVRVVHAFVDIPELEELGFEIKGQSGISKEMSMKPTLKKTSNVSGSTRSFIANANKLLITLMEPLSEDGDLIIPCSKERKKSVGSLPLFTLATI